MKGLEELKNINAMYRGEQPATMPRFYKSYYIIEKELKALEIIRKYSLCEEGLIAEGMRNYNKFSKEESDLLKEVLKNE